MFLYILSRRNKIIFFDTDTQLQWVIFACERFHQSFIVKKPFIFIYLEISDAGIIVAYDTVAIAPWRGGDG
jgi:hypothetical protein